MIGLAGWVLAGDLQPPPGPVAPTSPSLAEVLVAAQSGGGSGPGGAVAGRAVAANFALPEPASWARVSTGDGVIRRVIMTALTSSPGTVQLRDASGRFAVLRSTLPTGESVSIEIGAAYEGFLDWGTLSAVNVALTFVIED